MIVIKDVLAATDFSECSAAAIEQAKVMADLFGARLHLLHVVAQPLHDTWAAYAPGDDFLDYVEQLEKEARRRLDALAHVEGAIEEVVLATVWGDPSTEILKYAGDRGIDLVVCGTHGRRGLSHIMMGSVAERVVRLAPCPVLTVHAASAAAAA